MSRFISRYPQRGSGRSLRHLPIVLKHNIEVAVVPGDGIVRPGAFKTTTDRVAAFTSPKAVFPAKALLLKT